MSRNVEKAFVRLYAVPFAKLLRQKIAIYAKTLGKINATLAFRYQLPGKKCFEARGNFGGTLFEIDQGGIQRTHSVVPKRQLGVCFSSPNQLSSDVSRSNPGWNLAAEYQLPLVRVFMVPQKLLDVRI